MLCSLQLAGLAAALKELGSAIPRPFQIVTISLDPTEPPETAPYPFPAISHEPRMGELVDDLTRAGHKPFPLPAIPERRRGSGSSDPC